MKKKSHGTYFHNTYTSYLKKASLGPYTEMGSLYRPTAFSHQRNMYPISNFYANHFINQHQNYYVWMVYSCQKFKYYTQTKISPPPHLRILHQAPVT